MKWLIIALLIIPMFISCMAVPISASTSRPTTLDILDKGDGTRIELQNNPKATDVSMAELMKFLESYGLQKHFYTEYEKPNAFAAEDLHNVAEAEGIRCAVVYAWVAKGTIHAFNLFEADGQKVYVSAMLLGTPVIASENLGNYSFRWHIPAKGSIVEQNWERPLGKEDSFYVFW